MVDSLYDRAVRYVKRELEAGYSEEEIKRALVEAGYPEEDIKEIFEELKEEKKIRFITIGRRVMQPPEPPSRFRLVKLALTVVLVVVAVLLISYMFFLDIWNFFINIFYV